jgi:hypothetical protein
MRYNEKYHPPSSAHTQLNGIFLQIKETGEFLTQILVVTGAILPAN